ncbi:LOW QUALITY PROTEIN: ciliogenesis-associated TTC17-interacting protein [Diceros bicornis minor]|uniref:LOW QUALITY PROTEIN: ciliogenesis-associated TTC17-interacting protein n=1 Tax=Diceros bicornis minor TaxID=77932 RepID=UPI0026F1A9FA|nr:LOW QUALITY PROTEIN: ciliogenesis-associated TTC17-interacting protein [Diceros bicornis minor]
METAGYRPGSAGSMSSKVQSTGPRAQEHQPSAQESLPPPEANADAIHFLSSLRPDELQMLFFSETLVMVSDTGEPQGELTTEVQRGKYRGVAAHCLLVHAFSRGFMDKMLCGNSLLGYLSWKLEILEQHSQEFIKFPVLPMERKMTLLKQDDQLAMTRSVKEGTEVKTEVASFPWHSVAGFISEAANLVLLRVMAWRRMVPSNARFLALDTEGKLCHSTYQALGSQTIQLGRQQVEVFTVEQTVHSEEGIPMSCQFYLLSDGHLAKRVQVGSPGCCMITKMPILREEDEIEPRPVFEKKPLVWEEDMELYSRFTDRKEELRASHSSYLRQHPEAHALISDFLLFLLLRQPADVVTFAAEFFGPFDVRRPPTPALRSSNRPSPFRSLDPERSPSEH